VQARLTNAFAVNACRPCASTPVVHCHSDFGCDSDCHTLCSTPPTCPGTGAVAYRSAMMTRPPSLAGTSTPT